ncbi:MAG TPA: HDIG domain-containing protein [Deinococcales bacterium]|nr:HDIG domain-containing protein [Deinococcales bacterium]
MKLRERALELMHEWTETENLRKHMLAVESALVACARKYGEDEDLWAATGILHDFDYEKHPEAGPDGHPAVGVRYLREQGWPEELCHAIMAHADYPGAPPRDTLLARALYACDEITGLITAAVLVRPDRDIRQLKLSSVRKRYRSRGFAAGVNREDVERGAAELGEDLWDHIAFVVEAMQANAARLGLAGNG